MDLPNDNFLERLRNAVAVSDGMRAFAKKAGVSYPVISRLLSPTHKKPNIKLETYQKIIAALPHDEYPTDPPPAREVKECETGYQLSEEEKKLVAMYRSLPSKDREKVTGEASKAWTKNMLKSERTG